ncbi:TetR/AcrR family transcriptional regulator [Nocardia nepalensis]|uniref:TetR/AcrR family transcriptional regulator n=1 Tax=Nocardia nepalensis TaxID=3375448 RepID=UPI003B673709
MSPILNEKVCTRSSVDTRTARLRHRRQQILATAAEIFANRGYHATAMDEIAHAAYMSKPVLYQHFPSKLDLYLAVLQTRLDTLVPAIQTASTLTGNRRARLSAIAQTYFDFADSDPAGFHLVFESPVATEPSVEYRLARATTHCVDAIRDAIAPAGTNTHEHHISTIATGLVGMLRFTAASWLDAHRPVPKPDAVAIATDLCWGGLSQVPLQQP